MLARLSSKSPCNNHKSAVKFSHFYCIRSHDNRHKIFLFGLRARPVVSSPWKKEDLVTLIDEWPFTLRAPIRRVLSDKRDTHLLNSHPQNICRPLLLSTDTAEFVAPSSAKPDIVADDLRPILLSADQTPGDWWCKVCLRRPISMAITSWTWNDSITNNTGGDYL